MQRLSSLGRSPMTSETSEFSFSRDGMGWHGMGENKVCHFLPVMAPFCFSCFVRGWRPKRVCDRSCIPCKTMGRCSIRSLPGSPRVGCLHRTSLDVPLCGLALKTRTMGLFYTAIRTWWVSSIPTLESCPCRALFDLRTKTSPLQRRRPAKGTWLFLGCESWVSSRTSGAAGSAVALRLRKRPSELRCPASPREIHSLLSSSRRSRRQTSSSGTMRKRQTRPGLRCAEYARMCDVYMSLPQKDTKAIHSIALRFIVPMKERCSQGSSEMR